MFGKRIVVKVGTSTLTYENGRPHLHRMEKLCRVLCDLQNRGREVILVSSGAIGVGVGKLGLKSRPEKTAEKQAMAAVGQCELMSMYEKFCSEYNRTVAQMLLTRDVVENNSTKQNVINTFNTLIDMEIIPIVNENDTVSIDELEGQNFGDNDMLSAIVAELTNADLLVILTDIDGLYDSNPRENKNARRIARVEKITNEIHEMAGGTGSNRGTGGMATKLLAAEYANKNGIDCCVLNGEEPKILYSLLAGEDVGTLFVAGSDN
ncbi:MAG: glutamate 5-kinase [Bacillota bacterium]|nr:glutamate 5-kinase [Bacillota bacterium]